ncbi:MAG TPA: pirin family protein [Planctomycetota bacterium]|nr:pirin family protein [Planctomycetota bacterium]
MIARRPAGERGRTRTEWLDSAHTFSFDRYHDPRFESFRSLRVVNDDRVAPSAGFPMHGHRDMEIVTVVYEGELEHRDDLGNGSVIRPGEVQRMSAGTGIVHSEMNPSPHDAVRLLQIWILPEKRGLAPGYEQRSFGDAGAALRLVGSRDGRDGSVTIHQDVRLWRLQTKGKERARLELAHGRFAWIQVARGALDVNGTRLGEGDGAAVSGEKSLELATEGAALALAFDLA